MPVGWQLEQQVAGDLNADHRPDAVLMLVEQPVADKATKDENGLRRSRTLVVLLTQADGTLRRVGLGTKALYCTRCFPQLDYTQIGTPAITIRQGQILVQHTSGSSQVLAQTQRYRYEPASTRMRLVGEDYRRLDRPAAKFVSATTDFQTGQQVVRRGPSGRDAPTPAPITRTVKVLPQYLEDVNLQGNLPAWLPNDFFD